MLHKVKTSSANRILQLVVKDNNINKLDARQGENRTFHDRYYIIVSLSNGSVYNVSPAVTRMAKLTQNL